MSFAPFLLSGIQKIALAGMPRVGGLRVPRIATPRPATMPTANPFSGNKAVVATRSPSLGAPVKMASLAQVAHASRPAGDHAGLVAGAGLLGVTGVVGHNVVNYLQTPEALQPLKPLHPIPSYAVAQRLRAAPLGAAPVEAGAVNAWLPAPQQVP